MPKHQSPKIVGDLSDLPSIIEESNVAPKITPPSINAGRGQGIVHETKAPIFTKEVAVPVFDTDTDTDPNIVRGLVLENTRTKNGRFVTGIKIAIYHPTTGVEIVVPYFMSSEQKTSDLPKIFSIVTVRLAVDQSTRDRIRYKIDEILSEERTVLSDALFETIKPLINMPEFKTLYLSDLASAINTHGTTNAAYAALGVTEIIGIIPHPLLFIGRCK